MLMNKLLFWIKFISLGWLINSLLLPTLGVAQTCTPPVYTDSAPISERAHDTGCITNTSAGWSGKTLLRSYQFNKQAGAGGTFTFTIVEPARSNPPNIRTGTKIKIYQDNQGVATYSHSLISQPSQGTSADTRYPVFSILATNATTVKLDLYLEAEVGNCESMMSPEFTISEIKFAPKINNVPTTTNYPGTISERAHDTGCITNTSAGWSGKTLLQTIQFDKQVGAGGTFSFTITEPPRTNAPNIRTGTKLKIYQDNQAVTPYSHSLISQGVGPPDVRYPVFSLAATNATTVKLDLYLEAEIGSCESMMSPEFTISEIKFTTLGPPRLPIPQVADVELCQAGTARLVVTNPSPQAEYYWFTDPNATTEVHRGTTYDFAATGNTQVYVQALPANGGIDCASARKAVNITVYNVSATFSIDAALSGPVPYLQGYTIGFLALGGYDTYTWNWGDNTPPEVRTAATSSHAYAQPGTYEVTLTVYKAYPKVAGGGCSVTGKLAGIVVTATLCEIQSLGGGQVQQNTRSGAISYVLPDSKCLPVVSFECLGDASTIVEEPVLKNVVSATAMAFASQLVSGAAPSANPYLAGQWRTVPQASYSFRTSLNPDANPQNYSFGAFTLRPFDWENSLRARPAAWLTSAVTEQVSANGDVLQERDPLGILSTAKFGYGVTGVGTSAQVLPYLQAHNADYQSVLFESFENTYAAGGQVYAEDGLLLPADVQPVRCDLATANSCLAHTGNSCALLANRQLQLLPIPLTPQLNAGGLLVKTWLRLPNYQPGQFTASVLLYRAGSVASSVAMTSTVRTGDWLLFEAQVPMSTTVTGASLGESLTPALQFSPDGASAVYIDDIRVQPVEAQMTAYVYDPVSLRLVASFDDQHFALKYQYNQEGKLIRKQAETVKGLKTLQETHYHAPTTDQVND
jgi:hypothetical protein